MTLEEALRWCEEHYCKAEFYHSAASNDRGSWYKWRVIRADHIGHSGYGDTLPEAVAEYQTKTPAGFKHEP